MALGLFAQIGLIAHLFSILVEPLGAQWAGIAIVGATLLAIVGRPFTGFLVRPGIDRRYFASLSYGIQICGSVIFIFRAAILFRTWRSALPCLIGVSATQPLSRL